MCRACGGLTVNAPRLKGRRVDPTRTGGLRKDFEKEFMRRWQKVIDAIIREVGRANGFGIVANRTPRFDFPTDPGKVVTFMSWLDAQVAKAVFGKGIKQKSHALSVRTWWGSRYVKAGYIRGAEDGSSRLRRSGARVSQDYARRVIGIDKHADAIEKAYIRAFDGLQNINTKMSEQIGQVISKGITDGKGAMQVARDIANRVEKIGVTRSRLLARTEINSAYNEAQLNVFEDAGMIGVELEPELLTAEDDKVCQECEDAALQSWTVETARGVLPIHPNCRCSWAPKIDRPIARKVNLQ